MHLIIVALTLFVSSLAHSQECPDLNIDGTWKLEGSLLKLRPGNSYRISQAGCYVLVYETHNKATWRIDISGRNKIKVPPEIVKANFDGAGTNAAQNVQNVEVALEPKWQSSNAWIAKLSADLELAAIPHFPLGLRAKTSAEMIVWHNNRCDYCSNNKTDRITLDLKHFEILDITEGLPSGLEKSSFISGINTVIDFYFMTVSYSGRQLLDLVKEN